MSGKVLLASPRGYCAGVDRAVDAVERALAKHGAPVYVRKQIVHNLHVVRDLESKGAVFVEEEMEVPAGAVVVLSAHGVAPDVYSNSRVRDLEVIDATCPLVTKVHMEARRFAQDGRTIVLIGHAGHEEVVGTTGQAPERTILVQSPEEARTVQIDDPDNLSYLTQTTLSVDETNEILEILRERFPGIEGPPREDICYATTNRQDAVKALAPAGGRGAGDRLEELIELEPPGGGERRARHAGVPGGRRDPRGPGLARGRRDGGAHVGRVARRSGSSTGCSRSSHRTGSTTSRS